MQESAFVLCTRHNPTVCFRCPRTGTASGSELTSDAVFRDGFLWLWCLSIRDQEGSHQALMHKSPGCAREQHCPIYSSGLQARAACWAPAIHPWRALQGYSRNAALCPRQHLASTHLNVAQAQQVCWCPLLVLFLHVSLAHCHFLPQLRSPAQSQNLSLQKKKTIAHINQKPLPLSTSTVPWPGHSGKRR